MNSSHGIIAKFKKAKADSPGDPIGRFKDVFYDMIDEAKYQLVENLLEYLGTK
jgi:hypothetical protein